MCLSCSCATRSTIRAPDVVVQGNVKIGACCVLSPQVRIVAEAGASIEIGSHNMIEDQVVIRCSAGKNLKIGTHNLVGVGSQLHDAQVCSICISVLSPRCDSDLGPMDMLADW